VRRRRSQNINAEQVVLATCASIAALTLAVVGWAGWGFYRLAAAERPYSSDYAVFGSSAPIGLACGAVALVLIAANIAYLLRKRLQTLAGIGSLRGFLDWHVIGGVLAAGYVALHANFEVRNWIARAAVYGLAIVLITGLVGRYLLRYVPRTERGARMSVSAFEDELLGLVDAVRADAVRDPAAIRALQELVDTVQETPHVLGLREAAGRLRRARGAVRAVERALGQRAGTAALRRRLARDARQAQVIHVAGRAMDAWRAFHRAFALLLLVALVAHVGIALYYGYGGAW
jgi:dihydropyrimidine dehydrogenase (NAD+) subunit PreT